MDDKGEGHTPSTMTTLCNFIYLSLHVTKGPPFHPFLMPKHRSCPKQSFRTVIEDIILKRAIRYLRCSDSDQVERGATLPRQCDAISKLCRDKNYQVRFISDEGVSGFRNDRPGFMEMQRLCDAGEVDVVIVYDLSRLSRNVRHTLAFIEDQLEQNRIEFVSIQNSIDTSTPWGKAFLGFNAIFAQLYRDEISFKTRLAMEHQKTKGVHVGRPPYGFRMGGQGRLVEVAAEHGVIDTILRWRSQSWSYTKIALELRKRGTLNRKGTNWAPQTVKRICNR